MENRPACLVIEADPDFRVLITAVLTRAGFNVHAVDSGAYAIAAAASNSALSLITLDFALPDMDGHDVARGLRALSSAPLLILTARSGQDDMLAAMVSGAAAYLTKPFSPRELVRTAQDLVPIARRA
jgi:two-component system, OmpR family, response regulator